MSAPLQSVTMILRVAMALFLAGDALAAVRVVPLPDGAITPDADVGPDGTIHVAYFQADDVHYMTSDDDGKSWADAIRINSEAKTAFAGRFRGPDLTVATDGRVHVVWYTSAYQRKLPPDEWGIHYANLKPGEKTFSEAKNLNHRPSDNYSIAAGARGDVAAVWTAGKLFVNLSNDAGETFDDPVPVANADPCECCATRSLFTGEDEVTIFYREKRNDIRDMHLISVRTNGEVSNLIRVSSESWNIVGCPMTGSDVRATGQGLAAAWETKGKVRYARVELQGKPWSPGTIAVADSGRYPVVLTRGEAAVVAWKDGRTLRWAEYDSNGAATGLMGHFDAGNRDRPAGVVTADGDYLLFP